MTPGMTYPLAPRAHITKAHREDDDEPDNPFVFQKLKLFPTDRVRAMRMKQLTR